MGLGAVVNDWTICGVLCMTAAIFRLARRQLVACIDRGETTQMLKSVVPRSYWKHIPVWAHRLHIELNALRGLRDGHPMYYDSYFRYRNMENPRALFDVALKCLKEHPHVLQCLGERPEVPLLPKAVVCRASKGVTEIAMSFPLAVRNSIVAEVKLKSLGPRVEYMYVIPQETFSHLFLPFCIRPASKEWKFYIQGEEWGFFDEFKEQTEGWDWEERP